MFTKAELKAFLSGICTDAHFVKVEFESPEKFLVAIKCKIKTDAGIDYYNQYFTEWMKKFSQFTTTNWIVRTSFPKSVRMVYRKIYACHLSGFNKTKNVYYDRSRNKNCLAKIHFKIKKIGRGTIRNDPLLKQNLNLNILVNYSHSHSTRDRECYHLLKSSDEIDQMFFDYFEKGFQTASAKSYHELMLIEKYGDDDENLINATINPTARHVSYLFGKKSKMFKKEQAVRSVDSLMADKKIDLENSGGTLIYTENAELAVVVTPFMKRVFQELNSEIVIIDSTAIHQCVMTFFYVLSKIGALPIACALHTSQEEANFSQALLTVKITLESNEFNRVFDPKILVTSHLEELKKAVALVFPGCNRFSSTFDMCRMFWAWLCDDENSSGRRKRNPLMLPFRNMVTTNDPDVSERLYEELLTHEQTTPKIREYIEKEWSTQFMCDQILQYCDSNTVETSLIFFKEFVIQRCKPFSMSMIVEVLVNIFEIHLNRLVLNYVKGRQSLAFLTKFLAKTKDIMDFSSGLQRHSAKEFRMASQGKSRRHFTLRTDTYCCDCCIGLRGQFCEHLCAIINNVETDFRTLPVLGDGEKHFFLSLCSKDVIEEDDRSINLEIPIDEDDEEETKVKEEFEKDFIGDDEDSKLSSSPKQETNHDDNGYYLLDIKTSHEDRNDPLEEILDDDETDEVIASTSTGKIAEPELTPEEFKANYDKAMKDINNEFRRLNKLFKSNANKCNLGTMVRLTRELAKIRPIERVNLNDMKIEIDEDEESCSKKRKFHDD